MTKLSLFLILFLVVTISIVPAFADDNERDDDDERIDFDKRDDERGDDDNEETRLGTGISDMILYVTIAAIAGTVGYTGFKIITTKRPELVKK